MPCRQVCGIVTLLFGAAFIIIGILVPTIVNDAFDNAIEDKLPVEAEDIEEFSVPDAIVKQVCVWNYTNLDEAAASADVLLNVEDICYDFEVVEVKYNVSFTDDSNRVQYWSRSQRTDRTEEVTSRLDSEVLSVLNLEYFIGRSRARAAILYAFANSTSAEVISAASAGLLDVTEAAAFKEFFVADPTRSVTFLEGNARGTVFYESDEWIAVGIDSAATQAGVALFMNGVVTSGFISAATAAGSSAAAPFLSIPARIMVDLVAASYDTDDEHFAANADSLFELYSGADDLDDTLAMYSFEGSTSYDAWKEPVEFDKARDPTQLKPFQQDDLPDSANVWVHNTRRSVEFTREEETTFKDIKLQRFRIAESEFLSAANNADNDIYDMYSSDALLYIGRTSKDDNGDYTQDPLWLTLPHMLRVEDSVTSLISGQSPDEDVHEPYLDFEMRTGKAFQGAKRLQLNVRMESGSLPDTYAGIQAADQADMFLPVYWGEDYGAISDEDADEFKSVQLVIDILRPVLIAVGALMMLLSVICLRPRKAQSAKTGKATTY